MSWLLPGFLAGGLAIGLPILLHFLRRKTKVRLPFPTLRFLGPTAVRETSRHRLRRWLVLLFRCLVFLLLAAGFSRPFRSSHSGTRRNAMVILVDNSFSLQAEDHWKKLKEWSQYETRDLAPGDRAGILLMHPQPRWLVPMTEEVGKVKNVLKKLEPGFQNTHYRASLQAAADALTAIAADHHKMVWMGDHQKIGWAGVDFSQHLPPGIQIDFPPPPEPVKRQASILQAQWSEGHGGLVLDVMVHQFTPENDERLLTLQENGNVLASQKIALNATTVNRFSFALDGCDPRQAHQIKVALDPDSLPVDDVFYALYQPVAANQVMLAPSKAGEVDYLRHALTATRRMNFLPLETAPIPMAPWPVTQVALLRGEEPFKRADPLDAFLKGGGAACLFVDGGRAQQAWLRSHGIKASLLPSSEAPFHLRDLDPQHPLFSSDEQQSLLPLLDLEFGEGWTLEGEGLIPIANWEENGMAMGEIDLEQGKVLLCGFSMSRTVSEWPVKPSFLPFVHRTVAWLMQSKKSSRDWKVGDLIPLPEGEGEWTALDSPMAGLPRKVSGSVRPDAPGFYRFNQGRRESFYAVNLSPEESDLSPWPNPNEWFKLQSMEKEPAQTGSLLTTTLPREIAEQQQRFWVWLLAAAALLLLSEAALANRTSI